ncbi:MAG: muramoyltetrapeptide carboxypeptidase [Acidobacteriota bacterium]|jgi:muramoyltetrapeptide carboxypeptidase|nr:muramoyltetrapeptide carboxypeptidase [Acidobacteriota bacterium]
MERRNFLAGVGAAAAFPALRAAIIDSPPDLVRPKALRPGDTVGLITPATEVPDPDRLALVERTMTYFKLKMKRGRNVGRRFGTYRESVEARLDDLHSMFRDPEVNAIFCIRGGYASAHLLDRIDYGLIRRNPKIFIGYSDITAMHLAINRHAGLVTFHGPMALSRFTDYTQLYFRKALFETRPIGKITNPPDSNDLRPAHALRTVRSGTASGKLIGGNLSLVSTTLGTPYEIDTRGKILFIEDVEEQAYSIDRMLTHLRLAGKFDQVAGVIWGECQDCGPRDFQPSTTTPFTVGEVVDNILGGLKVPVLSGLTIGHTSDQLTLPLGVAATLDATAGTLEIKEAGVV